jgi:hypothetical protein
MLKKGGEGQIGATDAALGFIDALEQAYDSSSATQPRALPVMGMNWAWQACVPGR